MNKFSDDDDNPLIKMWKEYKKKILIKVWPGATVLLESGYIWLLFHKIVLYFKTALHTKLSSELVDA